jgi:hypothetical protein
MAVHYPKPKAGLYTVETFPGLGHYVFGPHGRRVAGPYEAKNRALAECKEMQAVADAKAKRGPRNCLCCDEQFTSEGPHNRMCGRCRLRGDDTVSYSFAVSRRRTG